MADRYNLTAEQLATRLKVSLWLRYEPGAPPERAWEVGEVNGFGDRAYGPTLDEAASSYAANLVKHQMMEAKRHAESSRTWEQDAIDLDRKLRGAG